LSDTLEPGSEASGVPKPMLIARRDFPEGTMLYGQFSVYGAQKDGSTGMPRVSAGWEIRAADGTVRQRANATVINPTSLGRLTRLVGTTLKDFSPGSYEFVLSLKDEVSGKLLEVKQPFAVVSTPTSSGD
jgi:hypothetical protein